MLDGEYLYSRCRKYCPYKSKEKQIYNYRIEWSGTEQHQLHFPFITSEAYFPRPPINISIRTTVFLCREIALKWTLVVGCSENNSM